MLEHTFCHLPRAGARLEQQLWETGILSWDDFIQAEIYPLPPDRTLHYREELAACRRQLSDKNPLFFSELLPTREHWRLYPSFRGAVAFVDIETTGLSRFHEAITTIALYDGTRVHTYVQGENLDRFPEDIRRYGLLVTYNGKSFDLPFIERYFGITIPQAHIDLMHLLRSLGYRGGLKGCERAFGLHRDELDGMDGYAAVLLWQEYVRSGERAVLETLLAYNVEDVVNLEVLLVHACNLKLRGTPFAEVLRLPLPERPALPFQPHRRIVDRFRRG